MTAWTGHYGAWLQKRGIKRTADRTDAFHAGWTARDAEVEELRYLLQQHSELHSGWMDKQTLDRTQKALAETQK